MAGFIVRMAERVQELFYTYFGQFFGRYSRSGFSKRVHEILERFLRTAFDRFRLGITRILQLETCEPRTMNGSDYQELSVKYE